jgi:thiol-disulfide isomerase/thioredoxin
MKRLSQPIAITRYLPLILNNKINARVVLASLILLSVAVITACSQPQKSVAPDSIFTTITGKKIALKDLTDKAVLVTFWATSCPSCITEIPHLVALHKQYHNQGLEIIAVAMFYDIPSRVIAMSQAKQLPYDITLDVQAVHAREFGDILLTPSTFLISPDHKIIWSGLGSFNVNDMKNRIKTLLRG